MMKKSLHQTHLIFIITLGYHIFNGIMDSVDSPILGIETIHTLNTIQFYIYGYALNFKDIAITLHQESWLL